MTRKIEQQMIDAIRSVIADPCFSGRYWKNANTLVFQNHYGVCNTPGYERTIEVILYETVIALIEPSIHRISIYTGGWDTVTTRSRLNAVLGAFSPSWQVAKQNGQMVLRNRWGDLEPFTEGRSLEFGGC